MLFFSVSVMAQKTHTVKQGETFESVAKQYGTTARELKKQNPNVDMLFSGLLLNIPQAQQKGTGKENLQKQDRIDMRDGSYILCKVIGIKNTTVTLEQEEVEGPITLQTKDIIQIEYTDGKKKTFKK